jgi:D-alanine-D-alanine ligase-like ATP-grasp enzyme
MKLEKANDEVFDYDAKYEENQEIKEIFPEIKEELLEKLNSESLKIYNHFNVK